MNSLKVKISENKSKTKIDNSLQNETNFEDIKNKKIQSKYLILTLPKLFNQPYDSCYLLGAEKFEYFLISQIGFSVIVSSNSVLNRFLRQRICDEDFHISTPFAFYLFICSNCRFVEERQCNSHQIFRGYHHRW